MASNGWYAPDSDPLADVLAVVDRMRKPLPIGKVPVTQLYDLCDGPSFRELYMSEMDRLTRDIERWGYRVWFTCEVDGTEYRLVAPRDYREIK